jgi:trigger factor
MVDEQTTKPEAEKNLEETVKIKANIVSIEDSGVLKKKVKVEVPREEIDKKLDGSYKELSRSAAIPGFRIGRAPRSLIERRFAKDIKEQVRVQLIALAIDQTIEETKLETLGEPDLDLDKIVLPDSGPLTFEYEVEIQPQFELPALEGIAVTENEATVTEKDIDEQIENYRWQLASLKDVPADGKTEKNDHIEADTVFEINGEPPIVKHDTPLDLRSIPVEGVTFEDLADKTAGLKVGESKTLEAKVADTHMTEAWRGKTAKLTVTVKKIFRWEKPELTDDFAKKYGYDDVKGLKESVKTELEARKGQQVRRDMEEQVRKYLTTNAKVDIPEGVAERQTARVLYRRVLELKQYGVPEVLIEQKLDDLKAKAKTQAVEDMKLFFIFDKIARQYEMEIPVEEINGTIAALAAQSGRRPERVREEMVKDGTIANVKDMIKERKVLEKLLEKAKITKGQSK